MRLLPAYDNYLIGHGNRRLAVPLGNLPDVWPGGGIIRATIVVDGRCVATWRRRGSSIDVSPFQPLTTAVHAAVAALGT